MGSGQAKMGMTEDFEASLQVLRGYDTDITAEVNEIKVSSWTMSIFFGNLNQLGHRTSTLRTKSWFMLIFRPFSKYHH
jgi:SP family facilitated glucose transporter-like MFS transporter 8